MCPYCKDHSSRIVRKGFFSKKSTRATRIQRFLCRKCNRSFSTQTGTLTYRERKPHVTQRLARLLTRGVSQRAAAELLGIHPITVARKLVRLGEFAAKRLETYVRDEPFRPTVLFDEMETFEHTKCKPLSIALAVEDRSRRILAVEVAQMPAKGRLAAISRKKYGRRPDHRPKALRRMFERILLANPNVTTLISDESPRYPRFVGEYCPKAEHRRFKGRRGCIVGQGELKAGGRDPLFFLNHTAAMIRDNVKRLSRKTWCTTKRPDRLQAILNLYAWIHNARLDRAGRLAAV